VLKSRLISLCTDCSSRAGSQRMIAMLITSQ
jgi:hypothetical protein